MPRAMSVRGGYPVAVLPILSALVHRWTGARFAHCTPVKQEAKNAGKSTLRQIGNRIADDSEVQTRLREKGVVLRWLTEEMVWLAT